jgi:hypothetical protein
MPGAYKEPASAFPTGSLRSLAATYFALLQSWEFGTAMALASHLRWRKLSSALQTLAQAEAAYHAGAVVEGRAARASLQRKLDAAAADVEACLLHIGPSATPHSTPHSAPRATLLASREAPAPHSDSSGSESSHSPRQQSHRARQLSGGGGGSAGKRHGSGYSTSPQSSSHPFHSPLLFDAKTGSGGGSAARQGGAILIKVTDWLSSAFERFVTCGGGSTSHAGMPSGLEHLLGQHGLLSSPVLPRFSPASCHAEIEPPADAPPEARVAALLIEFLRLIGLRRQMLGVYAAIGTALGDADTAAVEAQVRRVQEKGG